LIVITWTLTHVRQRTQIPCEVSVLHRLRYVGFVGLNLIQNLL
jgi:hypothetical protein